MEIKLKSGIDKLLFGMKTQDVEGLYGKPDKQYQDEEDNTIYTYNHTKLRLTFYAEEGFRLGYVLGAHAKLELQGVACIGRDIAAVKKDLAEKGLTKWAHESYDTFDNWFNEDQWLILQTEFGEVVKVELGAIINDKDEFDWKFPSK